MKEINVIPAKTKVSEYFALLLCAIFIGGFIGCLPIILHELLYPLTITQTQRNSYVLVGIAICIFCVYRFSVNNKDKYYWLLTENSLVRGRNKKDLFYLNDIEKVIIGIPAWEGLSGKLFKATHLDGTFKSSLILKLGKNTFIPLNIHMVENGTELMTELIDRFKDRIDENYDFSKLEKKHLYSPKWNSVITLKTT